MRRGLTYAFRVEGGDDPYDPDFYNPLVISTDPVGGFERLSNEKDSRIRVLAGLEYTRRGVPRPTASGTVELLKNNDFKCDRMEKIQVEGQKVKQL